jgi:hypothetical protein
MEGNWQMSRRGTLGIFHGIFLAIMPVLHEFPKTITNHHKNIDFYAKKE